MRQIGRHSVVFQCVRMRRLRVVMGNEQYRLNTQKKEGNEEEEQGSVKYFCQTKPYETLETYTKHILNSTDKLLRRDLFLDEQVFDVLALIFPFQFQKDGRKTGNYNVHIDIHYGQNMEVLQMR